MYFISLSIKVLWVSANSFLSEFAAGYFLGELRLICRGRGREKRMWHQKDAEGVASSHSEGPGLARPGHPGPCISVLSPPGAMLGDVLRKEGGERVT